MAAASRCKAVSIINYLCFSLSLSLSFTPLHTETHTKHFTHGCAQTHTHCQRCTRFARRNCTNARTIAFSVRQKLAEENGSCCHFVSVFQFTMKHDSCWDRWSHILPEVIHLLVHSKALADLMGADIMRGTGSSCLLRVKSSTHPNYHLQQHPPRGAAPHHFQPSDPQTIHTRSHIA